jgi:hypothetical protein
MDDMTMPFEQWSSLISGQKKSFFSAEEIRIGLHGTKRNQTDTQSIGLLFSPVLSNVEVAPPPPKPLPVVASCSCLWPAPPQFPIPHHRRHSIWRRDTTSQVPFRSLSRRAASHSSSVTHPSCPRPVTHWTGVGLVPTLTWRRHTSTFLVGKHPSSIERAVRWFSLLVWRLCPWCGSEQSNLGIH